MLDLLAALLAFGLGGTVTIGAHKLFGPSHFILPKYHEREDYAKLQNPIEPWRTHNGDRYHPGPPPHRPASPPKKSPLLYPSTHEVVANHPHYGLYTDNSDVMNEIPSLETIRTQEQENKVLNQYLRTRLSSIDNSDMDLEEEIHDAVQRFEGIMPENFRVSIASIEGTSIRLRVHYEIPKEKIIPSRYPINL